MRRFSVLGIAVLAFACGGSTSEDLMGTGGSTGGKGGTGTGGMSTGGMSTGGVGTGGVGTGGVGTGGVGIGGVGTGGISTGGVGAGGIGTGGIGTGGVGTGGIGTGGIGTGGIGTGGIGTGGVGTGGIGTGGIGTGGVGTGGTGGIADSCSKACQKITAINCPNEDPYSACFAGCQIDYTNYQAKCGSQTSAWMSCVNNVGKAACDSDGEAKILGCDAQLTTFIQCIGCIPSTGDTPCEACTKSSCCTELQNVYNHPQFGSYLSCVYACTTQACENNCYYQHSALQPSVNALAACEGAKCAAC